MASPAGELVESPESAGRPDRPRILWADDNADMREYVERLLGSRYQVQAVPSGEAALSAAQAAPPDLVLSDVMMPGMDGITLLRRLRSDPRTRQVPIILVSARAERSPGSKDSAPVRTITW
jgi:CheY-like chemotaxis protein